MSHFWNQPIKVMVIPEEELKDSDECKNQDVEDEDKHNENIDTIWRAGVGHTLHV